jgi:hypothetical protein
MSYLYSVLGSIGNVQEFAAAGSGWAGDRIKEFGATSINANQIIMGGELAGMCIIGFEFDSVDAAMAGQAALYQDSEIVQMMRDTQVSVSRRILFRVQSEIGEREGRYGSVLYIAGRPLDDASAASNLEHSWKTISEGANGMIGLQAVAAGASPFQGTVVTSTDSLDELMAASAKNFADPEMAKRMGEQGWNVIGRVLMNRLI